MTAETPADEADGLVHDAAGIRRLAAVGFACSLIANGIARFAYTPLMPVLVGEGWVTGAEAGYLAAINFTGYFFGVASALLLARRQGTGRAVRLMLVLCVVSLAMSALPWGFIWLQPWRFLAGYGGGVLMVVVPPAVLAQIPVARWGAASGAVFAGVGAGMAASGTVVPLLARLGATPAWLGLAGISLLLALLAHHWWREPKGDAPAAIPGKDGPRIGRAAMALLAGYGLYAVGMAPHAIFWVDYLARGLGLGVDVGGAHWALLGIVSAVAPLLAGRLVGRFSFGTVLTAGMVLMGIAVAIPLLSEAQPMLILSSVLFGLLFIGNVTLFAGRSAEIGGRQGQKRLWWLMSLAFALTQAAGSYGLSLLFEWTHSYLAIFGIGAAALFAGALFTLPRLARGPRPPAGD